jgi:hypothetical protein
MLGCGRLGWWPEVKKVRPREEADTAEPSLPDVTLLFLLVWMDELGSYQDDGELEPEA